MEFRDLKAQYKKYKNEIDSTIQEVIDSAVFIGGDKVIELEKRLAEYVGVKHCITCGNGTDAISLSLMGIGIGEGDAVFVPDFTFFASGEPVSYVGATPVFVDVDEDTFNIDVIKLELAIEKVIAEGKLKPKAVIPVDLFGLPANYDKILPLAEKYNLIVLEDSAQGFGGNIRGKKACSFGHIATTSFFPAKPLGCYGDGGAIFTDNDEWAELIKSLKVHGKGQDKYDNVRIGVNSRLDAIQAVILNVKLTAFINHELKDVNNVYNLYKEKLKDVIEAPYIPEGYESSFAQYTIKLENKEQRDKLLLAFKGADIPAMVYYATPMHKQGAFAYLNYNDEDFAVSNRLCDTVLSLPMHPYMKEEDMDKVVEVIKNIIGR